MSLLLPVLLVALANGAGQEPDDSLAIVHVNVLPMEAEERVLADHAVLVRDGRIVAVAPSAKLEIPQGTKIVDGEGRYLLPGLADMHVHVQGEQELLLNLAAGVTSVRNLWGLPMHLAMQARIEAGEVLGPTVYTTGPITDGVPPSWEGSVAIDDPDAAFEEVLRQRSAGFESIKVYSLLTEEVYVALVDAAHELDMRVTGHVPAQVGIRTALAIGQDCIEHLEGYFGWSGSGPGEARDELIALTLEAGTWNCCTLVVMDHISMLGDVADLEARPEMRFVEPSTRASWDPEFDWRFRSYDEAAFGFMKARVRTMQAFVKALHAAGGRILVGTDTPNPYVVPGFAVHDELALLVEAGLSEHETLLAATAHPARFLGRVKEFGRVAPGLRADLLLLEENPLEDIAHTRERAGVVVRGRWLPREELDRRLEELAASFEAEVLAVQEDPLLLPVEGELLIGGRYEMQYNGVVVGAQRVGVKPNPAGYEIYSRGVQTDGSETSLMLFCDEQLQESGFIFEQKTSELQATIGGKRKDGLMTLDGSPEAGIAGSVEVSEETLSNLPGLGALQLLALRLQTLAVGDELRFDEVELDSVLRVTRRDNVATCLHEREGVRAYRVESRTDSRVVELEADEEGRLLAARIRQQIGVQVYVLVD